MAKLKGRFRIQSNIQDRAFFKKIDQRLNTLFIFVKSPTLDIQLSKKLPLYYFEIHHKTKNKKQIVIVFLI